MPVHLNGRAAAACGRLRSRLASNRLCDGVRPSAGAGAQGPSGLKTSIPSRGESAWSPWTELGKQVTDYLNPIQVRGLAAKTRTTATTGPSPRLSPSDYSVRPAELRAGTIRAVGPRVFTRQRGQASSLHQTHESLLDHSPPRGRVSTHSLDSLRDASRATHVG